MIAIRNFSDRLRSPGLLYDRSRSWSRSSTALVTILSNYVTATAYLARASACEPPTQSINLHAPLSTHMTQLCHGLATWSNTREDHFPRQTWTDPEQLKIKKKYRESSYPRCTLKNSDCVCVEPSWHSRCHITVSDVKQRRIHSLCSKRARRKADTLVANPSIWLSEVCGHPCQL